MDSSYLWHQQKQTQDNVHNGLGTSSSTSSSSLRNGVEQNGHGGVQSQQWEHGYGYDNASSGSSGSQAVHQSIPQSYYDPNWNLYEDFREISGPMQPSSALNTISPAAILAQRAPNGSSQGQGTVMDGPTTIDPTLMMTLPFPRYISPTQTQYLPQSQLQRPSAYQQHTPYLPMSGADSSLSDVVNYEPPPQTIPAPQPPPSPLPNPSSTGITGTALHPPLIDQVKKLLTPKQLDRDPQASAQKLIDLLLPPTPKLTPTDANSLPPSVTTDKDTRMEILTRLRDHAPGGFFVVFSRNAAALALLREWGKNACKKEEFGETLMGWLQVVDKLPLTVEALAQSGLGKLIKYVVEHPPTTAIKDMAAKIESGWKKAIASQQDTKTESELRTKKRKLETSTAPLKGTSTTAGGASSASTTPATKKAAVVNPAGVRIAVRKDSLNSPTTGTFPSTAGTTGSAPKGAQSDSGFFSAKPKAKLPSFRKKPITSTTQTPSTAAGSTNSPEGTLASTYTNPFEDAMKSLRKTSDSPALQNVGSSGSVVVSGVSTPPGISAKTGKPKKRVKFDDKDLEKVRYIERAIYDDDTPGFSGFQGQSYRDLDRAEGNLLKHMLAQIEWFEPPPVNFSDMPNPPQRGERSTEAKAQAEREMSALAAFYQGAPPDTPVEPPQLAALPLTVDDSSATTMLLGTRIEEEIQGGRPDTVMSAGHWLGQLGTDGLGGAEHGAGMAGPYGAVGQGSLPPQNAMIPGSTPAAGKEGITDILNKLMKVVAQPEGGATQAPVQPQYGAPYGPAGAAGYQQNTPPASGVDNAAIISALTALGMLPATQQPGEYGDQSGYGGMYANAASYGSGPASGPYGTMSSGLPPPLHNGMPGREEQEDRWRRSAKGDAAVNGKRGKKKDVPASQNTWKPLCTFFARGKCRFGEDCDFSHDPSKIPK